MDLTMKNFIIGFLIAKPILTGLNRKCEGESKTKYFPEVIEVFYVGLTSKSFRSGLLKHNW